MKNTETDYDTPAYKIDPKKLMAHIAKIKSAKNKPVSKPVAYVSEKQKLEEQLSHLRGAEARAFFVKHQNILVPKAVSL